MEAAREPAVAGDRADLDGVEIPLGEGRLDRRNLVGPGGDQHPFLGFGQEDLIRRHALFPLGDPIEVDGRALARFSRHFGGRAGQPGGAHVLDPDDDSPLHDLEAGFHQELFLERIADLDVGPLGFSVPAEFLGGHRGSVDAVAAGLGPDVEKDVAGVFGPGVENLVLFGQAQAEDVDQGIQRIALVETGLAADGRHADGIAVGGDAGDDPFHDRAVLGIIERPEAEGIHQGDRPGAHGEDIPENAADARGRALERLDEGGMVVRFDLEDDDPAFADVDDPGVLPGTLDDVGGPRRQRLEKHLGALVRAVLRPHGREEAELGQVGFPADQLDDEAVLVGGQVVPGQNRVVVEARFHGLFSRRDVRTTRPSTLPRTGSTARSGWGISPQTFPSLLMSPATA